MNPIYNETKIHISTKLEIYSHSNQCHCHLNENNLAKNQSCNAWRWERFVWSYKSDQIQIYLFDQRKCEEHLFIIYLILDI